MENSRQIRFRAWHVPTKKMVDLQVCIPTDDATFILMQFTGLHDATTWDELTEDERASWTRSGKMPSEWQGKEIYEGDCLYYNGVPCPHCFKILYPHTTGDYEVKWDHKVMGWVAKKGDDWIDPEMWGELKISGNIYENKGE